MIKHMDMRRGSQPHHARLKRLGKKAIFYGRIANALGVAQAEAERTGLFANGLKRIRTLKLTRKQWALSAASVVLALGAVFGNTMYQSHRAAAVKAAEIAEFRRVEKINATAQECYKKKTAEKQQMLGKVTFDQLYDGDSCIASQ